MDIKVKHRIIGIAVMIVLGAIIIPVLFSRPSTGIKTAKLSVDLSNQSHSLVTRQLNIPPDQSTAVVKPDKQAPMNPDLATQALQPAGSKMVSNKPVSLAGNSNTQTVTSLPTGTSTAAPSKQTSTATQLNNPVSNAKQSEAPATDQATNETNAAMTSTAVRAHPRAIHQKNAVRSERNIRNKHHGINTAIRQHKKEYRSAGSWAIQVGSFSQKKNAELLIKKLRAQGYPAYMHQAKGKGSAINKVYVGPEVKREKADQIMKRLHENFNLKGFVIKYKI